MGRTWQVSPLEILIPSEELERIVAAYRSRLVRRVAVFSFAALRRGRGRIPNALRDEARRLGRCESLLAFSRRPRRDRYDRQESFAFAGTGRCCPCRAGELLTPAPWRFADRSRLAAQLATALLGFEKDRAERKEQAREFNLAPEERRWLMRATKLLERGDGAGANKIVRALLAAA